MIYTRTNLTGYRKKKNRGYHGSSERNVLIGFSLKSGVLYVALGVLLPSMHPGGKLDGNATRKTSRADHIRNGLKTKLRILNGTVKNLGGHGLRPAVFHRLVKPLIAS